MTFEPGNAGDLRKKILYLLENSEKISNLGKTARNYIEQNLNPEKHYKELMKIYNLALNKHN